MEDISEEGRRHVAAGEGRLECSDVEAEIGHFVDDTAEGEGGREGGRKG